MMTETPIFQAEVVPHRSLSPRGMSWLLAVVAFMVGVNATVFVLLGAWPVAGFSGVELLLATVLFRLNVRAGKASEFLTLTHAGLHIERVDPDGTRRATLLTPAWLKLSLEERPGRAPLLVAIERRRQVEIARDLGEDEKRSLAAALSEALDRLRNPMFDNPQLRDDWAG
jgi:uncharacterized membrane protein